MTKYMNIAGLSEYFAVSTSTIRGWVKQGTIPKDAYLKIGSTYRFDLGMIETLFRAKTQEDTADITEMEDDTPEAPEAETQDEATLEIIDEDM